MKEMAAVTLSNENGPSRSRLPLESCPPASGGQRPANTPGWRSPRLTEGGQIAHRKRRP
jgi:hypothetical protein